MSPVLEGFTTGAGEESGTDHVITGTEVHRCIMGGAGIVLRAGGEHRLGRGEGLGGAEFCTVLTTCEGSAFLAGLGAWQPHQADLCLRHAMHIAGPWQDLARGTGQALNRQGLYRLGGDSLHTASKPLSLASIFWKSAPFEGGTLTA